MSSLQQMAERLVASPPGAAPDHSGPGPMAPAGVVLGVHAGGAGDAAAAGFRTVDWTPGRVGVDPMTVDTHHDLASVTKVVATTAALLRLVSAGLVELDAEIFRYLPRFRGGGREQVTVRDLLLHRGGLREWHPLYFEAEDAERGYRAAESLPLRYPPGVERHYSDLGFMLLGRVVTVATGQDLASSVAELVTRPLGLGDTRFGHPAGDGAATGARDDRIEMAMVDTGQPYPVPFRAANFPRWRHGPVHAEVSDGNAFHVFGGTAGHAGLFSTVPDLLRFGAALSGYQHLEDLWRPEVVEEFFAAGPDDGQALGFRRYPVEVAGRTMTVLGHPGFVGCALGFVPGQDLAFALATNRLLVEGDPLPTEKLWRKFLSEAAPDAAVHSVHPALHVN